MKTSLPFEYKVFKQPLFTLVKLLVVVNNKSFTVRGNIKCRAGPFSLFQAVSSGLIRTHENDEFSSGGLHKTSFSLRKSCMYKRILNLRTLNNENDSI